MNLIKTLGVLLFLSSVMACGADLHLQIPDTQSFNPITGQRSSVTPEDFIRMLLIYKLQAIQDGMHIDDDSGYDNTTTLYYAAFLGDTETVELLLAMEADPTKTNKFGCTPLHVAARRGKLGVVTTLLKHSLTCVGQKDNTGKTASDYADENGHEAIVSWLKNFHPNDEMLLSEPM